MVAGLQLDSFWEANPEAALNREMFSQMFKALGDHVALNQTSQEDALREQQAMLEQQAKETREVAQRVANEAAAKEAEVLRLQELQRQQVAAEHERVAAATARDLQAHQVIEQQKLLAQQNLLAASSNLDPTKVEPLAVVQANTAEEHAAKWKGNTSSLIEQVERQLNQKSKEIEPDEKTEDTMETDKDKDEVQDSKQNKVVS